MFQVRPSVEPVLAGDDELRGGKRERAPWVDDADALECGGVSGAMKPQQILGLFVKLRERRARGEARGIRHDDLLSHRPYPHDGQKEDRNRGTT